MIKIIYIIFGLMACLAGNCSNNTANEDENTENYPADDDDDDNDDDDNDDNNDNNDDNDDDNDDDDNDDNNNDDDNNDNNNNDDNNNNNNDDDDNNNDNNDDNNDDNDHDFDSDSDTDTGSDSTSDSDNDSDSDSETEMESQPFSFVALSDTHSHPGLIDWQNKFHQGMAEVVELAPNAATIVFSGDITEAASDAEYDVFFEILNSYDHPPAYMVMGNHDVRWLSGYDEAYNRYINKTGMPHSYFDKWISGHHFIFIATEQDLKDDAFLSPEQLTWIEETLAVGAKNNKPIFMVCHQGINDTSSGAHGILQGDELKAILSNYPQTILISGHSHMPVSNAGNLYQKEFIAITAGAFARKETTYIDGLFFYVREDSVEIKGRDFDSKTWVFEEVIYPGRQQKRKKRL